MPLGRVPIITLCPPITFDRVPTAGIMTCILRKGKASRSVFVLWKEHASHTCLPKKTKLLEQRTQNFMFFENVDLDLQHTSTSHNLCANMK